MIYVKTCVLCDTKIRSSHRLCTPHYIEFKEQMHEPWFKELSAMQQTQDNIDRRENKTLPYSTGTDLKGVYQQPELLSKREVGRPSTDWRLVQIVLKLYDDSVDAVRDGKASRPKSLRSIAKEMNEAIGFMTVGNILRQYRKNVYQKEIM